MNNEYKDMMKLRKIDPLNDEICHVGDWKNKGKCKFLSVQHDIECILYHEDLSGDIHSPCRCVMCLADMNPDTNIKVIKMLKQIKKHLGIK